MQESAHVFIHSFHLGPEHTHTHTHTATHTLYTPKSGLSWHFAKCFGPSKLTGKA